MFVHYAASALSLSGGYAQWFDVYVGPEPEVPLSPLSAKSGRTKVLGNRRAGVG